MDLLHWKDSISMEENIFGVLPLIAAPLKKKRGGGLEALFQVHDRVIYSISVVSLTVSTFNTKQN